MSKLTRVVLAMVIASLAISGCGPVKKEGVFGSYERVSSMSAPKLDLTNPKSPSETLKDNAAYSASFRATGKASVKVLQVGNVIAVCPLQDLQPGDRVEVQQNSDGTWAVVGRL